MFFLQIYIGSKEAFHQSFISFVEWKLQKIKKKIKISAQSKLEIRKLKWNDNMNLTSLRITSQKNWLGRIRVQQKLGLDPGPIRIRLDSRTPLFILTF